LFIVTSVVVIKQSPVGRWIFAESQAKYSRIYGLLKEMMGSPFLPIVALTDIL